MRRPNEENEATKLLRKHGIIASDFQYIESKRGRKNIIDIEYYQERTKPLWFARVLSFFKKKRNQQNST